MEGEFDLLLFSPRENVVVQVQAKAAIPPDGSRMVARGEARVQEAVNQLSAFSKLEKEGRDRVLSQALGANLSDVKVVDAILCWSGFGTKRVWDQLGNIAPLNIAILANLVKSEEPISLENLVVLSHDLARNISEDVTEDWVAEKLVFPTVTLEYPSLSQNEYAFLKYKKAMYL